MLTKPEAKAAAMKAVGLEDTTKIVIITRTRLDTPAAGVFGPMLWFILFLDIDESFLAHVIIDDQDASCVWVNQRRVMTTFNKDFPATGYLSGLSEEVYGQ